MQRLFVKVTHSILPQVKDRFPFLYFEYGRMEVDDSAVKWIGSDYSIVRVPIATILAIMLGPGTTITHEAIKVLSQANTTVLWVGEDSFLFYAVGESPTANTTNFRKQMNLASDKDKSLIVAKRMFSYRFPKAEIEDCTLDALKGKEGYRVRDIYCELAKKYNVGWKGRQYVPGNFELSDVTNKILTGCNAALYGVISSIIYSMGYSPYIGFVHSGCPLPFVYDLADLYKETLCMDLAFSLTLKMCGKYDKKTVLEEFRKRLIDFNLLEKVPKDIETILK